MGDEPKRRRRRDRTPSLAGSGRSAVAPANARRAESGGLYFLGNTSSDGRGDAAIQRFWPSVAEDYLTGIGPFARSHRFRRSDWQLFYLDNQALQGQVDGALETPGCPASTVDAFDFDEDNTLYYLCDEVLHRGAGEVIAEDVWRMLGVTDDGRVLAR